MSILDDLRTAWTGSIVSPPRLPDGTRVKLGLRVVLHRPTLIGWGLGHGWDDLVHQITNTGLRFDRIEIGPRQEGIAALRAAPHGAEITCLQCKTWFERYPVEAKS